MTYPEQDKIASIVADAQRIVIVQADNPDADSLGSALAMEQILGDLGKDPIMFCGVDIPGYLRYLEGWDRVVRDLPNNFDASIIVDASTTVLLEKLQQSGQQTWLTNKPCIVLDHHAEVSSVIPFATAMINQAGCSSTGELIYGLSKAIDWPLSIPAQTYLMTAILGDTQGLGNQLTSPNTYRVIADMVEGGVNRAKLEDARREAGKMPPLIFSYKARLIERTELLADGQVAIVIVPQQEISDFSPLYNPGPLIQGDMLQTAGVKVSIVLKSYDDGKVTAAIRCNNNAPIASKLATHFGGGGHAYASGFKIDPRTGGGKKVTEVYQECVVTASKLLDELNVID
jgi:phosphoesterase RecJ-like protein